MGEQTKRGLQSAYVCNGASNHSEVERELNDFYATPPIATKELIKYLKENYPEIDNDVIWEPACGKGHISQALINEGFNVVSTYLIDRGYRPGLYGENCNFLSEKNDYAAVHIITNPPYKYAQEFVEKAMEILKDGKLCCMFLKLTFLEGKKQYEMFKKFPPEKILVFSSRVNCAHSGNFEKEPERGGAVAYAWYIWRKGNTNSPVIEWIK